MVSNGDTVDPQLEKLIPAAHAVVQSGSEAATTFWSNEAVLGYKELSNGEQITDSMNDTITGGITSSYYYLKNGVTQSVPFLPSFDYL
jgi:hypothetical protein